MFNAELLYKALTLSDLELLAFILEWFREETVITDNDNYVYVKNDAQLVLVAHIDTLRDRGRPDLIIRNDAYIANTRGILGADDRAGVYMLLSLYRICKDNGIDLPQFIFTNYEESGGIGVGEFIDHDQLNRKKVRLFLEADRMGRNEYVHYHALPQQIASYVESFGYEHHHGIYSDIYDLTEAYSIPSVNVSAGYYMQHTRNEVLNVNHMQESMGRILNIIKDMDNIPAVGSFSKYYADADLFDIPEIEDDLVAEVKKEKIKKPKPGPRTRSKNKALTKKERKLLKKQRKRRGC